MKKLTEDERDSLKLNTRLEAPIWVYVVGVAVLLILGVFVWVVAQLQATAP